MDTSKNVPDLWFNALLGEGARQVKDIAREHQTKIAIKTMKLSCVGAKIMGGMNHREAVRFLNSTSFRAFILPASCTCEEATK